jgi:hypothetical protein
MISKRSLLRLLEREREAHAAERARLIDTLCNLAGKPWTLPPRPITDYDPIEEDTPDYLLDLH